MINEVALCNRGKPLYTLIKMDFGFTSKKRKNLKPLKWSVRQDNENLFQEVPRRLEWEARRWLPLYPPSPQDGVDVDLSPVPPAPRRLGRAVSPGRRQHWRRLRVKARGRAVLASESAEQVRLTSASPGGRQKRARVRSGCHLGLRLL